MDDKEVRICRKCLLRDIADKDQYADLYSYIKSISPEDKVPDDIYEKRLTICKNCDFLLSGMCVLCGCYVEMRAAMRVRCCPEIPARWETYEED